jgi:hypothetical protein
MVASSGISADVIATLNEGHQVTINFTGGASPTYAFVVELDGERRRVRVHGSIVSVHGRERSQRDVAFQPRSRQLEGGDRWLSEQGLRRARVRLLADEGNGRRAVLLLRVRATTTHASARPRSTRWRTRCR